MPKPHDKLATRTWIVLLSPFRKAATHVTIELDDLEADFWLDPGGGLASWTGRFGELAGEGLLIAESFVGYLNIEDLDNALLEVHAAPRLYRRWQRAESRIGSNNSETRGAPPTCLLIIAEHVGPAPLSVLEPEQLKEVEPGLWRYAQRFPCYIVDLTRLVFRPDTAMFHLLGRGPHWARAVSWLGSNLATRELARRLKEEVSLMQTTMTEREYTPEERQRAAEMLRLLQEDVRREGERTGRRQALVTACLDVWQGRFGEPSAWVPARLKASRSLTKLQGLVRDIALAPDLEAAEQAVRAKMGNGRN